MKLPNDDNSPFDCKSPLLVSGRQKLSLFRRCFNFLTCQKAFKDLSNLKQSLQSIGSSIVDESLNGQKYQGKVVQSNQVSPTATESKVLQLIVNETRPQKKYRVNNCCLLFEGNFMMVVKETQKIISCCVNFREDISNFFHHPYIAQVKYNQTDLQQMAPLQLAKYVAMRCKQNQSIIDISASAGLFSIQVFFVQYQFAQYIPNAINFVENQEDMNNTFNNCQLFKAQHDIDLIRQNFLHQNIKQKGIDLLFIDFTLRNTIYNFSEYFQKAIAITSNLVMLLPASFDCAIIATEYHKIDKNRKESLKTFAIEQESIIINKSIEYFIVYTGQSGQISQQEEYLTISEVLLKSGSHVLDIDFGQCLTKVIQEVENRVGPYQLLQWIAEIYKTNKRNMLQIFITQVVQFEVMDPRELKKIAYEYNNTTSHKTSSPSLQSINLLRLDSQSQIEIEAGARDQFQFSKYATNSLLNDSFSQFTNDDFQHK